MNDRPNILFIHVDQMHWQAMPAGDKAEMALPIATDCLQPAEEILA